MGAWGRDVGPDTWKHPYRTLGARTLQPPRLVHVLEFTKFFMKTMHGDNIDFPFLCSTIGMAWADSRTVFVAADTQTPFLLVDLAVYCCYVLVQARRVLLA